MTRRIRRLFRPFPAGILVFALLAATVLVSFARSQRLPSVPRVAGNDGLGISAIPSDDPTLAPVPPSPSPSPKPLAAKPSLKRRGRPGPNPSVFRRLGTWIDAFDYSIAPESSARSMRVLGVRTLYLQTGRYNLPDDFKDPDALAAWLRAAHANGIVVVGWYLPGYGNLERDVHRTVAIANFRTADGQKFDGIGVDIEEKCEVDTSAPCRNAPEKPGMTDADWNEGIITHARRVRAAVGRSFPLAAIVPPPLGMDIRPGHWTGFPWTGLPISFDAVMPMAYWSFRDDCPSRPDHCAYGYTKRNVEAVRELMGSSGVPIHPIGGIADDVAETEVSDYVRACAEARAYGGSLYDFRSTTSAAWSLLGKLNSL